MSSQSTSNQQDIAIEQAVREYEEFGVITTTSYVALSEAGLVADDVIATIEKEYQSNGE